MDGARFVSVVKGKEAVISTTQQNLADNSKPKIDNSADQAVKLSLQSKLELISDVKKIKADVGPELDRGSFAIRSLKYINRLATKVQKLLDDNGAVLDSKRELKVQELLNELARVVGYGGADSNFLNIAGGVKQIAKSIEGVLQSKDSLGTFASTLEGATNFYGAAVIEKVKSGDSASLSRVADNLTNIQQAVGAVINQPVSQISEAVDQIAGFSSKALQELGTDSPILASETDNGETAERSGDNIDFAKEAGLVINFDEAKKLLTKFLGEIKQGVNFDQLVRATTDKVA